MSDLGKRVEREVGVIGLSFLDDVAWVARGGTTNEVAQKMETCAKITKEWAEENAVVFEDEKSEAIIFTKNTRLRKRIKRKIQIGKEIITFNQDATRWLGVWLDRELRLNKHHHIWMAKAKRQQASIQRLCHQHALLAYSTGNL